jgi:sucrose-6-phosphate hydrolase SacC (GH32 family)
MEKVKVEIGTKFRAVIADCNALWEVTRKAGRGGWEAVVVEKDSDYAGTTRLFKSDEIRRSVTMAQYFQQSEDAHADYYASLNEGDLVHYDNGFDQYIRCKVVRTPEGNKLLPLAMIGNWRQHDLPHRLRNGDIHWPYTAKSIIEGNMMTPGYTSIWECPDFSGRDRCKVDPTKLEAISLAVPDMDAATQRKARLLKKMESVRELLVSYSDSTQDTVMLKAVMKAAIAQLDNAVREDG